jgi:hypothetical protein
MSSSRERHHRTAGGAARGVSRVVTLVLAVGFAVVGVAGAASAHHNTINGTVTCKTGGGWSVAWSVENSEQITETITASNRPGVVPVGTQLTSRQTRTFTETVTAKPTSPLKLELAARWSNGTTATNSGSIPVSSFADGCNVTTVEAPSIPVVDECGPGNAHYGQVPTGPWTSTTNPDGSVTVTTTPGHQFPNGQTSITYPTPADSNQPCPTPPVTPPVVTPPVVTPPEVLPAEVRVVKPRARKLDKCGTRSDLFKVARRDGVVYTSRGKVLRQGTWLKANGRTVIVRAVAADDTFRLEGKRVWKMTFKTRRCAGAPEIAPNTGAR